MTPKPNSPQRAPRAPTKNKTKSNRQPAATKNSQEKMLEVLRESEERFRHVVEHIREVFFILTAETGQVEYTSPAYEVIWGRPVSEVYTRRDAWIDAVYPEDRERVAGLLARMVSGDEVDLEYRIIRPDGNLRWISGRAFPVRNAAGKFIRVVGIAEDITVRVEREQSLAETKDLLSRALAAAEERARENVALTEFLDIMQSCQSSQEAYDIVTRGLPKVMGTGKGALCVTSPSRNLVELVAGWGDQSVVRKTFEPSECWALRRGKLNWVAGPHSPTRCAHVEGVSEGGYLCVPLAAHGETIGVLFIEDLSPGASPPAVLQGEYGEALCRRAAAVGERISLALANILLREKLQIQSIRDPLTGLFNRRYMEESLEREVRRAVRNNEPITVLMLDLDNFKQFNDTFGHQGGDALLRAVGELLSQHSRDQDIACRYGGEEFTLILLGASAEAAGERAKELLRNIKELTVWHADRLLGRVTLSIGGAMYPGHGTGAELLSAADKALYRAKTEGRNRCIMSDNQDGA